MGMSNLDGYHPNKNESYQLGYQQGRADERAKVLEKVLNSEKFFGNYIDARDLTEWLKAHK